IGEIAELDPNLPELTALTSAFQAARRNRRQRHFGPWLAAAAVFGVLVLSASWLQDSHLLLSHPLNAIAGLVETRAPEPIVTATIDSATIEAKPAAPVGTAGVGDRDVAPVAAERQTPPVIDAPTEPPPLVRIPPPQPRPAPPMAEPESSAAPQPPPVVAASDVQLRGEAALATCHGSARYVPKVGSREPRVEPRTWSFTLRKTGPDWKIESARAER